MKKLISLFVVIALLASLFSFVSCNDTDGDIGETTTVTDLLGREVQVPTSVERVVCIGAGALRLYSYVGDMSKLCGVEDVERTRVSSVSLRPYQIVNESLFQSLPSCGLGGPSNQQAEPEKILACNPDVIFSLYSSSAEIADTLQNQTQIPVVVLRYGQNDPLAENVTKSISLIGKVMGAQERATQLNDYMQGLKDDLHNRTKDVANSAKPSAYLACNSYYGTHGFYDTSANYSVFNVANVKNAVDDMVVDAPGAIATINPESFYTNQPDYIFVDCGGLDRLKQEYAVAQNKEIYDSFEAFKEGRVYLQMPFNAYYTNIELALCTAYFDASVIYPTQFADVDIEDKIGEILTSFLGANCYQEIKDGMFGGYQRIENISEFLSEN